MDKGLKAFDLGEYDLDNLAPTLLGVYNGQQEKYKKEVLAPGLPFSKELSVPSGHPGKTCPPVVTARRK